MTAPSSLFTNSLTSVSTNAYHQLHAKYCVSSLKGVSRISSKQSYLGNIETIFRFQTTQNFQIFKFHFQPKANLNQFQILKNLELKNSFIQLNNTEEFSKPVHFHCNFHTSSKSKSRITALGENREGNSDENPMKNDEESFRSKKFYGKSGEVESTPKPPKFEKQRNWGKNTAYKSDLKHKRNDNAFNSTKNDLSKLSGAERRLVEKELKQKNTFSPNKSEYRDESRRSSETLNGERKSNSNPTAERKRRDKRNPFVDQQVTFETPIGKDLHVAIVGGGISGLACAHTLSEHGIKSTIFDTGKHGLGGRMATRHVAVKGQNEDFVFDHAAQFFTVSDERFSKVISDWSKKGLVREWKGSFGIIQEAGKVFKKERSGNKFVSVNGMRSLCDSLVFPSANPLISVERPSWISDMKAKEESWSLFENGKFHGNFDLVVIAHNGKCANRLLSSSGVPSIFRQMKSLELSSIWVLMAAFKKNLPSPQAQNFPKEETLEGAFVEGIPALTFMANNTLKLKKHSQTSGLEDKPHCWTFLSSALYAKQNKVPQENIPLVRAARVVKDMLRGVEHALGLEEGELPEPIFHKVQLWGAGLPLNSPKIDFIFDSVGRVGICGDFLKSANIESAYISGMELANHIARFRDNETESSVETFSVGLEKKFEKINGHDIGTFAESAEIVQLERVN